MEKFIGREEEFKKLNKLYHTAGFQMAVIYGRKRVGKSTLIAEFIKDKKAIYYMATKVGTTRNMELLSVFQKFVDHEWADKTGGFQLFGSGRVCAKLLE